MTEETDPRPLAERAANDDDSRLRKNKRPSPAPSYATPSTTVKGDHQITQNFTRRPSRGAADWGPWADVDRWTVSDDDDFGPVDPGYRDRCRAEVEKDPILSLRRHAGRVLDGMAADLATDFGEGAGS